MNIIYESEKKDLSNVLDIVELIYISWFVFEITIKFICSPNRIKFMFNFWNIIDFVSILPFFIWLLLSKYKISRHIKQVISILRVLLLLKINRLVFFNLILDQIYVYYF